YSKNQPSTRGNLCMRITRRLRPARDGAWRELSLAPRMNCSTGIRLWARGSQHRDSASFGTGALNNRPQIQVAVGDVDSQNAVALEMTDVSLEGLRLSKAGGRRQLPNPDAKCDGDHEFVPVEISGW